jgi:Hypothetical protein (DUF2513)
VKRDMELFRSMLMVVEISNSPDGCQVEIPGYSPEQLYEHAKLAQEAGFIEARFAGDYQNFHVLRLTYAGHEFLDAARDETRWEKAKALAIKNTGTLTLEGVKIALQLLIRQALGG